MNPTHLRLAVTLGRRLPPADLTALAEATRLGPTALHRTRAESANDTVRDACHGLTGALAAGADPAQLSGALLGAGSAARAVHDDNAVDVTWTGPTSRVTSGRLTAAVLSEMLEAARRDILLIGYAVRTEQVVADALSAAAGRGVEITLLLERHRDNPHYAGADTPFPDLSARRLAWPADHRPAGGAALHAKILVVDQRVALVGSANVTGWALGRNLECGILLRGTRARAIHDHIEALLDASVLVRI